MTAPHAPQAPAPPPATKQRGMGLGVAALVLGILAIIFSWIPFVNVVGIICGFVGLALALVGVFISHRWLSVIGGVLAIIGIILSFTVTNRAVNDINRQLNTAPTVQENGGTGGGAATGTATDAYGYKATGGSMSISYGTVSGNGGSMNTVDTDGSWSKSFTVQNKDILFTPSLTVTATDGSTVTCEITHNGKVVTHQSAHGQYAIADCTAG